MAMALATKQCFGYARDEDDLTLFIRWLTNAGETSGITSDGLWFLYMEYVEYSSAKPLTKGQLFKRLRAAGIHKYREPVGKRRWLYQVAMSDAEIIKLAV